MLGELSGPVTLDARARRVRNTAFTALPFGSSSSAFALVLHAGVPQPAPVALRLTHLLNLDPQRLTSGSTASFDGLADAEAGPRALSSHAERQGLSPSVDVGDPRAELGVCLVP